MNYKNRKRRRTFHMINTVIEICAKESMRKIDWYKSKHRTSEYFGSPLMKGNYIVKRWDLEANK